MSKPKSEPTPEPMLSRRELGKLAVLGAAGALLAPAARAQGVDPLPVDPLPVLPLPAAPPPPPQETPVTDTEGTYLTKMVPLNAGYALSDSQTKEVAAQLKDYPGGFAKARAYVLPDDIGPAFAAEAPPRRKERSK